MLRFLCTVTWKRATLTVQDETERATALVIDDANVVVRGCESSRIDHERSQDLVQRPTVSSLRIFLYQHEEPCQCKPSLSRHFQTVSRCDLVQTNRVSPGEQLATLGDEPARVASRDDLVDATLAVLDVERVGDSKPRERVDVVGVPESELTVRVAPRAKDVSRFYRLSPPPGTS